MVHKRHQGQARGVNSQPFISYCNPFLRLTSEDLEVLRLVMARHGNTPADDIAFSWGNNEDNVSHMCIVFTCHKSQD